MSVPFIGLKGRPARPVVDLFALVMRALRERVESSP